MTFSISLFHSYFFVLVLLLFLPLGWVTFPLSVDLGGTSSVSQFWTWFGAWGQGLGSLFWGMLVIYFIFSFLFRCVLDLFPFNRLKVTHCPGHSSALYHTGSPSLCWPLASSGSSSIPTWFSPSRPLAFLRPEPLQGWQYSWRVLRLAVLDLELIVWGCGPFGNYTGRGSRRTFLQVFQGGSFKGKAYDSDIPPPVVIDNFAACAKFSQFISDTIIEWVTAGVKRSGAQ